MNATVYASPDTDKYLDEGWYKIIPPHGSDAEAGWCPHSTVDVFLADGWDFAAGSGRQAYEVQRWAESGNSKHLTLGTDMVQAENGYMILVNGVESVSICRQDGETDETLRARAESALAITRKVCDRIELIDIAWQCRQF